MGLILYSLRPMKYEKLGWKPEIKTEYVNTYWIGPAYLILT